MIASIVLATFICSANVNAPDSCTSSYDEVWVSQADYKADVTDCLSMLKSRYPDDVITFDKDKFAFAGCYRVVKESNTTSRLVNVQDVDDFVIDSNSRLTVK